MPAFASYRDEQVQLSSGTPKTYSASPSATRQFCGDCGSPLFWREVGSGEVDVFLGTLDDPASVPPPSFAIWTKHRVPWLPKLGVARDYPEQRQDEAPE